MPCPVCSDPGPHPVLLRHLDPFGGREYSLLDCAACGAAYSDPMENPGPSWYAAAARTWEPGGKPGVPAWRLEAARLALAAGPGKPRLLEIGCSDGAFLLEARRLGFEVRGVDFDEAATARARAAGLDGVATASFETFAAASPGKFDVIVFFQTLEHLTDPRTFLALVNSLLAPGGRIIFDLPDAGRPLPSGSGLIDLPPHHLTRWRAATVRKFLDLGGFEPLSLVSLSSYALLSDALRSWAACRLGALKRRLLARAAGVPSGAGAGAAPAPSTEPSASFRLFDAVWRSLVGPLLSPLLLLWLAWLRARGRGFYLACAAVRRGRA